MEKNKEYWFRLVPGIPDVYFQRGQVPMTKEEVRVVSLAKGKVSSEAVVYDIGAGTGSLSIEAALLADKGQVWAIERKHEAVELIKKNRDYFKINNLNILPLEAPEGMNNLPKADVIFLGGSGGRLPEILEVSLIQLKSQGRIVVNAITNETFQETLNFAQKNGLDYEVVSIAVNRLEKMKKIHMWKSLNPVKIITIKKDTSKEIRI